MFGNIEKFNPPEETPSLINENKTENNQEALEINKKLRDSLEGIDDPKEMTEKIISASFLKYCLGSKDEIKEKTGIDFGRIEESLRGLESSESKDEFVEKAVPVLSEFEKLQKELENSDNPSFRQALERIKRRAFVNEDEKFTSVDDEDFISYHTSGYGKPIHMHIAHGREFNETQRYNLMIDGLIKLVEKAKDNNSPTIEGTSYANLIKKYSEALEYLGFTLAGEISKEDKQRYFPNVAEDTQIYRTYIEREKFDDLIDKSKKLKALMNKNRL